MMSYGVGSKWKSHGEVFTPAGVVFSMVLNPDLRELLTDVDKTAYDPAVGEGQFPCTELVLKLFCNVENIDEELALGALRALYGMDIQQTSVDKARGHLIQTLADSYRYFTGKDFARLGEARAIVVENISCGDSLKQMQNWTSPQVSLF